MQIDTAEAEQRFVQITLMIERYRDVQRRRLVRRGLRLWRRTEADRRFRRFEAPRQRVL